MRSRELKLPKALWPVSLETAQLFQVFLVWLLRSMHSFYSIFPLPLSLCCYAQGTVSLQEILTGFLSSLWVQVEGGHFCTHKTPVVRGHCAFRGSIGICLKQEHSVFVTLIIGLEGLLRHRWLGPAFGVSDSLDWVWSLRICISCKLPGDAEVLAGLGATFGDL